MKCQVMNIQIPLGELHRWAELFPAFPKMHTFAMIGVGLGQAQAQYLRGDSWPISLLLKRLAPESRYAARYWSKTNRHGPLSVLVLEELRDGWKIDADLLTPHPHRRLVIVDRADLRDLVSDDLNQLDQPMAWKKVFSHHFSNIHPSMATAMKCRAALVALAGWKKMHAQGQKEHT